MSLKIGDLVTVKNEEVKITQIDTSYGNVYEPIEIKVRKGLIFEILEIWQEYKVARITPVNYPITEDYILLVDIDKLNKCGRAVELLYIDRKAKK